MRAAAAVDEATVEETMRALARVAAESLSCEVGAVYLAEADRIEVIDRGWELGEPAGAGRGGAETGARRRSLPVLRAGRGRAAAARAARRGARDPLVLPARADGRRPRRAARRAHRRGAARLHAPLQAARPAARRRRLVRPRRRGSRGSGAPKRRLGCTRRSGSSTSEPRERDRRREQRHHVEPHVARGDARRRIAVGDAEPRQLAVPSATCRSPSRTARARRRRGTPPRRSRGSARARGKQQERHADRPATSRRGRTVRPSRPHAAAAAAAVATRRACAARARWRARARSGRRGRAPEARRAAGCAAGSGRRPRSASRSPRRSSRSRRRRAPARAAASGTRVSAPTSTSHVSDAERQLLRIVREVVEREAARRGTPRDPLRPELQLVPRRHRRELEQRAAAAPGCW